MYHIHIQTKHCSFQIQRDYTSHQWKQHSSWESKKKKYIVNKQDNLTICTSAARVCNTDRPRLVAGLLDTFTVTQLDSFIAIRRVINSEIIRWRQAVHQRILWKTTCDVFHDGLSLGVSLAKVYHCETRETYHLAA